MGQASRRARYGVSQADRVQGHCSWLGVWGRIAPVLPALLLAERGQQGGFESLLFSRGFGGGAPIASFFPAIPVVRGTRTTGMGLNLCNCPGSEFEMILAHRMDDICEK